MDPHLAAAQFCHSDRGAGVAVRRLGSDDDHLRHWSRWGFLQFARRRLRILAAPSDTFPWTLALGEIHAR